jgi:hypothetical protein
MKNFEIEMKLTCLFFVQFGLLVFSFFFPVVALGS